MDRARAGPCREHAREEIANGSRYTGDIVQILVILAGLSVFSMVTARFLRVDVTTLWPLGATDRDDFWRRTLPWPRGVQEDDGIAWRVPRPASPAALKASRMIGSLPVGRPIPPTQPQRRIGSH